MEKNYLEKWEKIGLSNNFIFNCVMSDNPDLCKKLLEILLDCKIDHIEKPVYENQFQTSIGSKGIRFDVYVKDDNNVYDIEIQTTKDRNLPKRSRYYQSVMDVSNLSPGDSYKELKKSYILFLCVFDPFGHNLPVYTFENICKEDSQIFLNDQAIKIFYNAKEYDKMKTKELKTFFEYLVKNDIKSDFTEHLDSKVQIAKMNKDYWRTYMTWEQELKIQAEILGEEIAEDIAKDMAKDIAKDMAEDIAKDMAKDMAKDIAKDMAKDMAEDIVKKASEKAYEQGKKESQIQTAKNFLEKGIPIDVISECTNIPREIIMALSLNNN